MNPRAARALRTGQLLALLLGALAAGAAPALSQELSLGEAIDAVLAQHPALAAAEARVDAAAEAGDVTRSARLPGASIDATLTHFQEPMLVAPIHSLDLAAPPTFDRTLVQGQLGVAYTLFDGGARSSRISGADAMYEASHFGRSATEMAVIEETAGAYLGVLAARSLLDAAVAQVQALQEEAERAQRRLDAGTAAELEVLRARASLQEARAQLASAEARVGLSTRSLARLMGVDSENVATAALADVSPGRTPTDADTLARSPVIEQADRAALAAQARLSEERAGRFPTVQAGAALLDFGTLDGGHLTEWQAGLQVSWPVFTGGARSASLRRAEAELAAARSDVDAAALQVAQAIDAAEASVIEADAREEALASAVTQWEEVARIEALALEAGSGVQSDLLRAQAGLFQARAGHARARYDAVLSRIALARAAGTLDRTWMDEALEASQ